MSRQSGLVRSSMIFSFFTLISRFMGLARDLVITAVMGASSNIAADAYNTALAFPNLFRRIFAEGAFTAAFVPAYSSMLEQEGEEAADRLATNALATLAAITLVLCIVFQLTMPWIMQLFSAGYVNDPAKFKLTVLLTQITMPYLPAMAIVALLSGVLNAKGRFVVSAVAPTILNAVMLMVVWPQKDPLSAAYAASWGVLIAGVAQSLLLIWAVKKSGATIGLVWPGLSPQIKTLMILAVPGALAAAATQINVFVSQWLSSGIDGARSWLTVADRLYQLPLGLIGVAIGVALLPALSRAVGAKDHEGAQKTMDQAVLFSMLLSFPAVAAIIGMPHYLIDGLYGRGQFNAHDVTETSKALLHYGWGVPAFVLSRILNPAFFARKDTFGPMKFALVSVFVNIALGLTLFPMIGVAGLAIATSTASWVNVILMWVVLGMRGTWVISKPALVSLLKVIIVAAIAVGLYWLAQSMRAQIEDLIASLTHLRHGLKEITVVGVCFAGLIIYIGLLFAFGAVKPSELKAVLRRK